MKKVNKSNIIMYALVVIALLMFSSTLTMAVLTDKKQGKEDIVFGKVAISGQNSLLELDIEDAVTIGTEILSQDRYLYFSPTSDTEDMIVRFKIEFQTDATDKTTEIGLLNSTLQSEYFDTASVSGESGYSYIEQYGYYYLVESDASEITLNNMRVVKKTESNVEFKLSEDYTFDGLTKAEQVSLFAGLVGTNIRLVVTVEAAQHEGLTAVTDAWPIVGSVNLKVNGESLRVIPTTTGKVQIPDVIPTASGYTFSVWEDQDGTVHNPEEVIELNDDIELTAKWAGLYYTAPANSVGVMDNQPAFTNWVSDLENYFDITDGVLSRNQTEMINTYTGTFYLPRTLTTANSACLFSNVHNLVLPSSVTQIASFANNLKLYSIVISPSVTSIEMRAFSACHLLREVKFAQGTADLNIGYAAFRECVSLVEIEIPERVSGIEALSFTKCRRLLHIRDLSGTNVSIEVMFDILDGWDSKNTANLYNVEIIRNNKDEFKNILTIDENTGTITCEIYGTGRKIYVGNVDPTIEYVEIPDGVNFINQAAFWRYSNLTTVVMPSSVRTIDAFAFNYQSSAQIYYKGSASEFSSNVTLKTGNNISNRIYYQVADENSIPEVPGKYWYYNAQNEIVPVVVQSE